MKIRRPGDGWKIKEKSKEHQENEAIAVVNIV